MKSLMYKTLTRFAFCTAILLLLATPLFYWLTKNYYAEDIIDIIEAVERGQSIPALDLERDIIMGITIQFGLIATVLGIAIVVMMRFISRRLWRPFNSTLKTVEDFRLEENVVPTMPDSDVKEFAQLNQSLTKLITNCLNSYRIQKEFTENASHELQTPLAVFRSKLDLLMQQPDITEQQADIIQDLYQSTSRLSQLNRNLLLLAKMENNQFRMDEQIDLVATIKALLPSLQMLADDIKISLNVKAEKVMLRANLSLFESMINNLLVNAIRHNKAQGDINIVIDKDSLSVANSSDGAALDAKQIFNRFYRPAGQSKGNGLGLSIVKSVCDYHGWQISYFYESERHIFTINFNSL